MASIIYLGDFSKYTEYLPMILAAFVSTLLLTPIIGRFATRNGIMDRPPSANDKRDPERHRRLEKAPRPLLGGLAVVIPFILLSLIFQELSSKIIAVLIGAVILVVLGYFDDRFRLSWKTQLAVQFFVILITIVSGIGISTVNNPFDGLFNLNVWEIPVALLGLKFNIEVFGHMVYVIWVLLCINAVKWSAGADGLMEGIVAIAALIFFLISVRSFDIESSVFSAILLGSIVAFLFYNFYPSKIFSGSIGKSVYGFILAVMAVISGAKFLLAIVILALPIVDMLWVMFGRARKSEEKGLLKKLSAMNKGDNTHLHHQLIKLGLSEREVSLVEYLVTAVLGIVAFTFSGSLRTVLLLIGLVIAGAVVIAISMASKNLAKNSQNKKENSDQKNKAEKA